MERVSTGVKTSPNGSKQLKSKDSSRLKNMTKIAIFISLLVVYIYYSRPGLGFHQKQTTQQAALPTRFFPTHSHVLDLPYGQLQPVINLLQDEELILVMYYAPWCAASVRAREEFLRAAKVLFNTVKSVAVNCWYTEGECRRNLHFASFPEIFVYHTGVQDGYRFTGMKQAEYLVKFVENFLYPIVPLHSEKQIQNFVGQNDNAVVGYFDFNSSPQPPGTGYHQFYLTALRATSFDFYNPVKFGVVFIERLASLLGVRNTDRFVLIRTGNSTLEYPQDFNMTSKNMTNWIFHFKQKHVAQWLVPPGVKSLTLSLPIQRGPAVFLFGPVNPLLNFNPYLDMVRIASYAYNSCGNFSSALMSRMMVLMAKTLSDLEQAKTLFKTCKSKHHSSHYAKKMPFNDPKCCVSLVSGLSTSVCEYCVEKTLPQNDQICDMGQDLSVGLSSVNLHSCTDLLTFYNVNEHRSVSCHDYLSGTSETYVVDDKGKRKMRRNTDPFVIYGAKAEVQRQCSKFSLGKLKDLSVIEELAKGVAQLKDVINSNFTGLSCRTNRTVQFYFIDNVYNSVFLERQQIPVVNKVLKPSVILADVHNEASFVMEANVTLGNIASFVEDYTNGRLVRHQRSADQKKTPVHCDQSSESVCITTVTTDTFQSVVLDNTKDVVLLYYADWCGFCSSFSHTYLKIAQYFNTSNTITFARVNGDTNDLPWEFNVDTYPTIVIFPATRKADSVMFPPDVPKTINNLVRFILHHTNYSIQLDTATQRCTQSCVKKNIQRIVQKREEIQRLLGQLRRRRQTLITLRPVRDEHQKHIQKAIEAAHKMYNLRMHQTRLINLLDYFLQSDFKDLDKDLLNDARKKV